MIPGMVFMGALTIPASLMIFFWETNEPKHISLFDIIKIFFVGGALSLLLAALMVVQTGGVINRQNLFTAPFLRLFSVSVGLHFLWDFVCFSLNNQTVLWILLIVLCTISWVFIVKLINHGLKEFKQRKPAEPAVANDLAP